MIGEKIDDLVPDEPEDGLELEGATETDNDEPEELELEDAAQIDEDDPEDGLESEDAAETDDDEPLYRRRHLRNILILVIIILLVVAGMIGVFVWRNSISPYVAESDTEALTTPSAGVDATAFTAVNPDLIPDFSTCLGMNLKDAIAVGGEYFAMGTKAQKASDKDVASLRYLTTGSLADAQGESIAAVSFGLDKDEKVVYVYCSFDLDALGVASADFDRLANDSTIATSLLVGMGVQQDALQSAKLTLAQDSSALKSKDTSGKERCIFQGSTGSKRAPRAWRVTETYDHSLGQTLGDNSVLRTLLVELY